jgi:hypothetical protein
MPRPPIIIHNDKWKMNTGQDPAKYLVYPGTVLSPGRHSPGNLRHARPYLVNGSKIFVFPVGVEGFRRSGQATLGLHRYIGGNTVDGVTIHYEEGRIELSGIFPGITSIDNKIDAINMLRSRPIETGLVLYAPGVFEREQYVLPENWNFDHEADDRTHSINYSIEFVRIGEGSKVKDPKGVTLPPNPSVRKIKPKGKPSRIFTIKDGVRTLRAVANEVYGNENRWDQLVELNSGQLTAWRRTVADEVPTMRLPTYRWPIGTKFRY